MPLKDKKSSGILLPLFSLGGGHGIGDFGPESYRFARFLKASGQHFWQILPLNPVDSFGSPYKSNSAFAGEILYISLENLVRDRYISAEDLPEIKNRSFVDYNEVREIKLPVIKKAAENFNTKSSYYKDFLKENAFWINDYALFCALGKEIDNMEEDLKFRLPKALKKFEEENKKEIEFYKITQYFFFKQFFELKSYLNKLNIKLIGDMPFYVSANSADVWSCPNNFLLSSDFSPAFVSGVPPDIFSVNGQCWENPIYDFDYQKKDGFSFFEKRFYHLFKMYDILRIDHFSGFARYYCIDANTKDARKGEFKEGIGEELFDSLKSFLKDKEIIAEDLGGEKEQSVQHLIKKYNIPNMKVLQFGLSGEKDNPFFPENYPENCVAYTGTHDNQTALSFYNNADLKQKAILDCLVSAPELPPGYRMIKAVMNSKAKLCIIPFADYICLENSGRINTPGTKKGNWMFRMNRSILTNFLAEDIKELSKR